MEVSPSASWGSRYSSTANTQHSCSQTEQLHRSSVTKFESISQPRTCCLFRVNAHQNSNVNRNHIVLASSHPRHYCRRHNLRKEKTQSEAGASRKHELEKETKLWCGPRLGGPGVRYHEVMKSVEYPGLVFIRIDVVPCKIIRGRARVETREGTLMRRDKKMEMTYSQR